MRRFSASHKIWFCDIWGVVHDGEKPYAVTTATLARHRAEGGIVILVSNSPRTHVGVEKQLLQFGVQPDSHDAVVTSGDVTRALMVSEGGGKLFHLGPARDISLFHGLDVARVSFEEAGAVVCSGLRDDDSESPDDYAGFLQQMKARNLTMICANPDKMVRVGGRLLYCAGALADVYEKMAGRVLMAGKPYAPIYALARSKAEGIMGVVADKATILAIGDGPETDILGATREGYPCIYVSGGVRDHVEDMDAELRHLKVLVPGARILAAVQQLEW